MTQLALIKDKDKTVIETEQELTYDLESLSITLESVTSLHSLANIIPRHSEDTAAIKIAHIATESILNKIDVPNIKMISIESIDNNSNIALEGIMSTLEKIWDFIASIIDKIMKGIGKLFKNESSQAKATVAKAKSSVKKSEEAVKNKETIEVPTDETTDVPPDTERYTDLQAAFYIPGTNNNTSTNVIQKLTDEETSVSAILSLNNEVAKASTYIKEEGIKLVTDMVTLMEDSTKDGMKANTDLFTVSDDAISSTINSIKDYLNSNVYHLLTTNYFSELNGLSTSVLDEHNLDSSTIDYDKSGLLTNFTYNRSLLYVDVSNDDKVSVPFIIPTISDIPSNLEVTYPTLDDNTRITELFLQRANEYEEYVKQNENNAKLITANVKDLVNTVRHGLKTLDDTYRTSSSKGSLVSIKEGLNNLKHLVDSMVKYVTVNNKVNQTLRDQHDIVKYYIDISLSNFSE